jgi:SAM-dependent methyltransferase
MSTITPDPNAPEAIRDLVRESYAEVVTRTTSCCDSSVVVDTRSISQGIGYSEDTLESVPADANLGLGCGNPTALASLLPGEVVVDLGAGAGLDALVAAKAVGPTGRVIGVDMTPEMLTSARKNAVEMGVHGYVEFREGLIENMPVAAESADVVISNCVINLSPDKPAAFREAFRVLKSGGRLAISDIVLSAPLPEAVLGMAEAYVACVSGAATEEDYLGAIREAGFVDVAFTRTSAAALFLGDFTDPMVKQAVKIVGEAQLKELIDTVWSYKITARKP